MRKHGHKIPGQWLMIQLNGYLQRICALSFVCFSCLIFNIMPLALPAQSTFSKTTFNSNNGLTHNFVQHITQDSTGFLWISTWDGLSRFDGNEFRNYFHKPNDPETFPFFIVEKTFVDKQNNVWVICPHRSITIYNRENDSFERFKPDGVNEFIASDIINGDSGDLWLINELQNQIYRYNPVINEILPFAIVMPDGSAPDLTYFLTKLIYDNNGGMWLICMRENRHEIYKTNFIEDGKIQLEAIDPLPPHYFEPIAEYRKHTVFDIFVAENGTTWFFTTFGLLHIPSGQNQLIKNAHKINPSLFSGKPYYYWWERKNGINIIDTKAGEIYNIKTDPGKHISTIFIDAQNDIWNGEYLETYEDIGLTRNVKTPDLFKHYLTDKNELGNQHLVFPILKDKNNDIWVGTRGLYHVFRIKPDGKIVKLKFTDRLKTGENPQVRSMVEDEDGIWLGCTYNVLVNYNFQNDRFTTHLLHNQGIPLYMHNILKVNKKVVINGSHVTYSFDPVSETLKPEYGVPNTEPKFSMVADGENGFWQGSTDNLIVRLDQGFKATGKYKIGDGNTNVEHICLGDNNDVWIAMMGGGLGHLFLGTDSFEIFTTADGLSNNTTYSILKGKKGNLWISTNRGISRFNPETKNFRTFGKAEGLMIEEFNSDSWFQAEDGEMFFGGVGGFVRFYPDSVEKNLAIQNQNRLLVTDFNVSGIPRYFKKPVYELDTVALEKGDNNFQLTFASINFKNADKINYRHRLLGSKNDNWIESDFRHRNISYANLAPGNYNLQIEATNIYGDWDSAISISIDIPAFFYQTLWFRILIAMFAGLVAVAIIVVYIRQIRLNAQQKQDVLKLESLRGQMNPHFIFNALNSINYFISNNDKVSANHYIADFSRLIRSFLTNLSKDYIAFDKELETLEDYLKLEHLRFGNKFDYELRADKIKNKEETFVFPGLVQPFVENAVWHGVRGLTGRKGFIKIEFLPVNAKMIRCIIEDDGIGREQSKLSKTYLPGKKSRGIGIVIERLKIISSIKKTDYRVVISDLAPSALNTGTLVMIDLPVK
jgi:ligand-binding sensor domain-containing protein